MSRARCERCARPLKHCLCHLIPRLSSRTRVLILQHPDEAGHALNTARLAALGLENAELQVGEVFADLHFDPVYRACLLFPGETAQVLPLAPSSSRLPWAIENLRFCPWCEQHAQKDLNDCPTCGRRMGPL